MFDPLFSRLASLLIRKFSAVLQGAIQVLRIAVMEAINGGSSLLDAREDADLLLVKQVPLNIMLASNGPRKHIEAGLFLPH